MVIGTFAYCGSGQDTLADSICTLFGYKKYSVGDIIRSIAESRGESKKRESLRKIRIEYDEKFGRNYFPNLLVRQIKRENVENAVISGIRTIQEYQIFKKFFNMKLIFVYAEENERYKRMLKRQNEKDEKDIELLTIQMREEVQTFDYEQLKIYADLVFDFTMDLEKYLECEQRIVYNLLKRL